ncbi:hypothetical protein [Afipia sp. P52-10]|uniref:hypothetical protein n=1 Tax=Afipia sp. P52-10 TaxID=1429916 RepID=UPI0004AEB0A4|nr:hypothetical protein [Afipia sp. P52-10]
MLRILVVGGLAPPDTKEVINRGRAQARPRNSSQRETLICVPVSGPYVSMALPTKMIAIILDRFAAGFAA